MFKNVKEKSVQGKLHWFRFFSGNSIFLPPPFLGVASRLKERAGQHRSIRSVRRYLAFGHHLTLWGASNVWRPEPIRPPQRWLASRCQSVRTPLLLCPLTHTQSLAGADAPPWNFHCSCGEVWLSAQVILGQQRNLWESFGPFWMGHPTSPFLPSPYCSGKGGILQFANKTFNVKQMSP